MNSFNFFEVMLESTCRVKGIDPAALYITVDSNTRATIHQEAQMNMYEMVSDFVDQKYNITTQVSAKNAHTDMLKKKKK